MNKIHKITFSINYVTNFRPNLTPISKKTNFFKFDRKNRLISRNFFLFMSSMKFFNQNNTFNKSSLFIKKFKKNVQTILRSPYRHKLTRHRLILNRYYITQKLEYLLNQSIKVHKNNELLHVIKTIKRLYVWFESNIVYHHKISFFFNFLFQNNFIIKNW